MGVIVVEGPDVFEANVAVSTYSINSKSAGFGTKVTVERNQPDGADCGHDGDDIALRSLRGRRCPAEESLAHGPAEETKRDEAHNERKAADAAVSMTHVVVVSVILSDRKNHTSIFHGKPPEIVFGLR